jgi:hypothetical protein
MSNLNINNNKKQAEIKIVEFRDKKCLISDIPAAHWRLLSCNNPPLPPLLVAWWWGGGQPYVYSHLDHGCHVTFYKVVEPVAPC